MPACDYGAESEVVCKKCDYGAERAVGEYNIPTERLPKTIGSDIITGQGEVMNVKEKL